ncbi:hypothetical protein ACHAQA_009145 [Verticillium albo-atrum]
MQLNEQDTTDGSLGHATTLRPAPFAVFPHEPLPSGLISIIKKELSSGFYGAFNATLLAAQAAAVICANSDASEDLLKDALHKFLSLAQDDTASDSALSCWLCVRMTLPTTNWVIPRWHTDGIMFDCACPPPQLPHSKYAFTILGPSTRVMVPDQAVTTLICGRSPTGRDWDTNDPDPELAARMAEFEEASVGLGQVIRFSWGQTDSPVHSEPDSSGQERVFISVLLASDEEIRDMCEFRGTEFGVWH